MTQSQNMNALQVKAITADESQPLLPEKRQIRLKPADHGRWAWQTLLAAFVFESLFWGFPMAFGIFQAYYSSLPQFATENKKIAVIGTLAQSLYYLGAPFSAMATKRLPRYRIHMIIAGWSLCILGLGIASFAESVLSLIATQGLLYGLGFVVPTYPILEMVGEWWIERKGMAFGLLSASSGLTGIAMPLVLEALLNRYGYQTTLRVCAVAMIILTAPLIPMLKGRLPESEAAQQPKVDWSFLKEPLLYLYAIATMIQGFGFFIPPIFISSYAIDIGLTSFQAALLLAVMGTAQTLGQFVLGWLSDKRAHVSLLACICCVIATIATATLWGLGRSFPVLFTYSVIYGFFAFGFGTLRVAMGRAITKEQSAALATYSVFVFIQGIGNVMLGPITAAVLSDTVNVVDYGASKYKGAVILVAITSILAALVVGAYHTLKWFSTIIGQIFCRDHSNLG